MENTKSPFDTLFSESLPRVLQAMDEYHALAVPHCAPEQIQLMGELQRRVRQCEFLLRNTGAIEQRQLAVAMNVFSAVAGGQRDADKRFDASCQDIDAMWLFTESFYWVAHKATSVILANHACFEGKRLPKMPVKIANGGVTNVRNHLIEHPYEYSNSFGLGSMRCGPVLSGGLGKDKKITVTRSKTPVCTSMRLNGLTPFHKFYPEPARSYEGRRSRQPRVVLTWRTHPNARHTRTEELPTHRASR